MFVVVFIVASAVMGECVSYLMASLHLVVAGTLPRLIRLLAEFCTCEAFPPTKEALRPVAPLYWKNTRT